MELRWMGKVAALRVSTDVVSPNETQLQAASKTEPRNVLNFNIITDRPN